MEALVDLDKVIVTFSDMDDLDRVTVRVVRPPTASASDDSAVHRLSDVLAATNVGTLERDGALRVWISPAVLRFHAAGQVDPQWAARLEARCASAENCGRPASMEATVVWPGERS